MNVVRCVAQFKINTNRSAESGGFFFLGKNKLLLCFIEMTEIYTSCLSCREFVAIVCKCVCFEKHSVSVRIP